MQSNSTATSDQVQGQTAIQRTCVYLPLTNAQQKLFAEVLDKCDAFTIRTVDDRCKPVRVEWVVLPSSDATSDDDDMTEDDSSTLEGDLRFEVPEDLDMRWEYTLEAGERVWVKTVEGAWAEGRVADLTPRVGFSSVYVDVHVVYYPVHFRMRDKPMTRRYFAPLNGDIKPDTPAIRRLLHEGGWL
ncbi:hypothetical protein WOLCODRAFT_14517 [Wolfiporia cocos MD-104 SS10]|uniref:Uncharacterized protein n=1 Tax=Wolfiporia cocos (strain MD-104) TaxID=742152 RepID=A0A2H3ISY3_WOLCO|nr:hypothetical protein WOLCODRAFT_14517 [Wolfiporia cocos MD-104 SS10]